MAEGGIDVGDGAIGVSATGIGVDVTKSGAEVGGIGVAVSNRDVASPCLVSLPATVGTVTLCCAPAESEKRMYAVATNTNVIESTIISPQVRKVRRILDIAADVQSWVNERQ